MPAIQKKVYQVSQEYLDGYHAAKNLYLTLYPLHYFKVIASDEYRKGFIRALNNTNRIF